LAQILNYLVVCKAHTNELLKALIWLVEKRGLQPHKKMLSKGTVVNGHCYTMYCSLLLHCFNQIKKRFWLFFYFFLV